MLFPVLFSGTRRRATVAQQLATLLGPTASFWLPGPAYFFSDAGKTTPCADTDPIRVWADASANGRDLSQATLAARPLARLIGGRWSASHDATDDTLGWTGTAIATGQNWSIAAVVRNDAAVLGVPAMVCRLRDSGAGNALLTLYPVTDLFRAEAFGAFLVDTADAAGAATRLVVGRTNGTTVRARQAAAEASAAATGASRSANLIDTGTAAGFPLGRHLIALVVSPTFLSDAQVTDLYTLLGSYL